MAADFDGKIKIIGFTGRSGSGKTTACRYLAEKGAAVIDCDEIAHNVLVDSPECREKVAARFGQDIKDENGQINRARLAARAFETPQTAKELTDITHPYIIKNILDRAREYEKSGRAYVYVDGAVIIGCEFEKYCDKIAVVAADEEESIKRLEKRDKLSAQRLKERLSKQLSLRQMTAVADYVIQNNGDLDALYRDTERVDNIIKELYIEK